MFEKLIGVGRAREFLGAVIKSNRQLKNPYPIEQLPESYALGIIMSEYPTGIGPDGKISQQGVKRIVRLLRSEAENYRRGKLTQGDSETPIKVFEIDELIDPTGHIRELYASIANALGKKLTGGEDMGILANGIRERIAALKEREDELGKREDALKKYERDATSGLYNAVKPLWESAPAPTDGERLPQYAERLTGGLADMAKGVAEEKADVEEAAGAIEKYLESQEKKE